MILQALKGYYDRKSADPDSGIAPIGWEWKEIPFLLVINQDGKFVSLQDTREGDGKKPRAKAFLVPSLGEKKGNGIKANLFWENIEYMLGIPVPTERKPSPDAERVAEQHKAFVERIRSLQGSHPFLCAVRSFLAGISREQIMSDPNWPEALKLNQALLFYIAGVGPITDNYDIRQLVTAGFEGKGRKGICMVTGQNDEIVLLEPPVKGVRGSNPTGACLVGFQRHSGYDSFGKEQGENAPIGKLASSAYTTALNTLLGKDSKQKVQVGDASTVFWAAKADKFESLVPNFFSEPPKDDPERLTNAVAALYKSADTGTSTFDGDDTRFYVLGLSPNAARISIRFWHCGTVAEMADHFRQHFDDLRITHGAKERDALSLWRLLVSTAPLEKLDNIPPNLAGDTMRSILEGLPYPETLLQAVIRRIKAEQAKKDKNGRGIPNVSYPRAALIKACINRKTRYKNPNIKEELKMSLDKENKNVGYRLGRLFAALEKIQQEASPGINATIRDRFYGAASGTPVAVFPNLMRLKNHHLAKLENTGRKIYFEKLIGEIMEEIADFPAHLPIADQGRFAVGYYHQQQDFFTKKENKN